MKSEYLRGASNALKELDDRLNDSIQRNRGAKTTQDVVNVFNDMVAGLHIMKQEVKNAESEDVEAEIANLINEFPFHFVLLGGDK